MDDLRQPKTKMQMRSGPLWRADPASLTARGTTETGTAAGPTLVHSQIHSQWWRCRWLADQGVTCTNGQVPIRNTKKLNYLSSSDRLPRSNVGQSCEKSVKTHEIRQIFLRRRRAGRIYLVVPIECVSWLCGSKYTKYAVFSAQVQIHKIQT